MILTVSFSHFFVVFFFLFHPLRGDGQDEVHSRASQDILVDLVGPANRPGQEIPGHQQNPCGPRPLSFPQSPWGPRRLSPLSEEAGERRENLGLLKKKGETETYFTVTDELTLSHT